MAIAIAVSVSLLGGILVFEDQQAGKAEQRFQKAKARLVADVKAARAAGYTEADLRPITSELPSLEKGSPPLWLADRASFHTQRAKHAEQLDARLKRRQPEVLQAARDDATAQATANRAALDRARQTGLDDSTLASLEQRLDGLSKGQGAALAVPEFRAVSQQAQALNKEVASLTTAQEQENQVLSQGAGQLRSQTGENVDALRKVGTDSMAAANNDVSLAAFLNKPSPFKGWPTVSAAYARMQKPSSKLSSGDANEVALAAFAAQRYAGQIHEALMSNLPVKVIVMSHQGQQLWAYENGKEVASTPITSGKPPNLATDIGPMKVLKKDSPWKMHSPWPKGSPYWYPDTSVEKVVWFTNTGEGLHDASWQPCCWGPGSQYGAYASHGCIHVPIETERFLFNWSSIGTPVIMYPGDGQPLDKQLAQITTDDQGNPSSGPKGA
ncbi:MAG: L,D-transpeptidase family protein [Candidatus Dormibacteraeota bacterium]|nr:L,D-transpeptidase family protein [Candidatus Dormibacteraeota bacterium]